MNSVNPTTDRIRGSLLALYRSVRFPTNESMRRWALAAIVVNVGITVTGAAVRVTGSGLGCPTWPRCTPDSFVPAKIDSHAPINMAIEFGNRLLSFLVLAVAAACVIAAWQLSRGNTAVRSCCGSRWCSRPASSSRPCGAGSWSTRCSTR